MKIEITEEMIKYSIHNLEKANNYTSSGCEEIEWRIDELKDQLEKIEKGQKFYIDLE